MTPYLTILSRAEGSIHIQLGNLATWVGGGLTVGALSLALWQLGMLRKDREARQAALVSVWISGSSVHFFEEDVNPSVTVELSFRNASTQPILKVFCKITLGSKYGWSGAEPLPPDGSIQTKSLTFRSISIEDP
jgi:hypothetical protein